MATRAPRRRRTPRPPRPRRRPPRPRRRRRRLPEDRPERRGGRERESGLDLALKALSHKERTAAEIEGWLRDRDVGEEELAGVMAQLAEAGAIDDRRFALGFAEDKRDLRGWGPDRIAEALRGRGVDERLIAEALAAEPHDEMMDRAVEVLAEAGATAETEAGRGKALALLARRGFPLDDAYAAVRRFEGRSSEAA